MIIQSTARISDQEVGVGNTTAWKIPALTNTTTIGAYFEIATPSGQAIPQGQRANIQFITQYQVL